jgi:hypothetical protein
MLDLCQCSARLGPRKAPPSTTNYLSLLVLRETQRAAWPGRRGEIVIKSTGDDVDGGDR